jgi:pantoate--beta-alanine ligase
VIVVERIAEVRALCDDARRAGRSVGLVPTMGYFHAGHRSLMRATRAADDFVVVSLFVNPLQFGPTEDLAAYPRDLERDAAAAAAEGVDVLFAPPVEEMYPAQTPLRTVVHVEELTAHLCGASRPTHFDGVTTVVAKLFSIVGPCRAYFGRKDAQQLAVVRRMAADLNLPVEIVGCPLVREADGLAMSSRNAYLTDGERVAALVLSRAVREAVDAIDAGSRDAGAVRAALVDRIATEPRVRLDYAEIVDATDLTTCNLTSGEFASGELASGDLASGEPLHGTILIAVAAFVGRTRLIDNATVTVSTSGVEADFGVLVSESEPQCAAS